MINYYYYIEVKHTESIFSPVSKVIIKPEDVPDMKYVPEEQQEKTFAAYAYNIWTAYRNNKQWYHYTLRIKFDDCCIHGLIGEHWTNTRLNTFYYDTYAEYKMFSDLLGYSPKEREEKKTA